MKIKEGFVLRKVAETNVVVPIGQNVVELNIMMTLNETGVFLWNLLSEEQTQPELVEALRSEFEVDADRAAKDIDTFIALLKENQLIECN